MSSIGTGYDVSAGQFSPDGRVFQVEYAHKAVENSGNVIAMRCSQGIVLGVEKLVTSKLYEPGANSRLFAIDEHIGMAAGGVIADGRRVVRVARDEAASYRSRYGLPCPVHVLSERVASYMHVYTLYGFTRPLGCSVILGSYDVKKEKPELYMIEPSGTCWGYLGCAIGKARQGAKTAIEKVLTGKDLNHDDLVKETAKVVYEVHDEMKDKHFELELGWVGKQSNGFYEKVPEKLFTEAEKYGKAALEESDSDGDT